MTRRTGTSGSGPDPASPMATAIHERLAAHNDQLERHQNRLNEHKKWLRQQAETPNLSRPGGDAHASGRAPEDEGFTGAPEISDYARNLKRDDPVEELLMEAADKYKRNREALRARYAEEEVAGVTGVPTINPESAAIDVGDLPVEERLTKFHFEKQAKLEKEREKKRRDEEMLRAKAHPKITKLSQVLERTGSIVDNSMQWEEARKKKIEQHRKQIEEREGTTLQSPSMSKKSARLVEGMDRDTDIATHLSNVVAERRMRLENRYQEENSRKQPGVPQITDVAARLQRDGPVHERLHEQHWLMSERRDEAERLREQILEFQGSTFSPRINYSPFYDDPKRGNKRIEDLLIEYQHQKQQERKAKIERMELEENALHHPRINPESERMASTLQQSVMERLMQKRPAREERDDSSLNRVDSNCTFKPKINAKSQEMERGRLVLKADRHSQLYLNRDRRNNIVEELKKAIDREELAECTFQPNVTPSKTNEVSTPQRSSDFVERMLQWQQRRDNKRRETKKKEADKELDGCTFRPNTAPEKPVSSTRPKSSKKKVWGVNEFVERQTEARRRREEAATVPFEAGKNWKNELTRPKSPKLGRNRDRIKALAKPTSASLARKANADLDLSTEDAREAYDMMQAHSSVLASFQEREASTADAPVRVGAFSQHGSVNILSESAAVNTSMDSAGSGPRGPRTPHTVLKEAEQAVLANPPSDEWLRMSRQKQEREVELLESQVSPRHRSIKPWREE